MVHIYWFIYGLLYMVYMSKLACQHVLYLFWMLIRFNSFWKLIILVFPTKTIKYCFYFLCFYFANIGKRFRMKMTTKKTCDLRVSGLRGALEREFERLAGDLPHEHDEEVGVGRRKAPLEWQVTAPKKWGSSYHHMVGKLLKIHIYCELMVDMGNMVKVG